ncbi:Nramp family divalent metal transporter [Pseudoalteromonas sp. SSDWG2]|uniref:Nramp family divalent metal transporter n=1 Tax=Pseudoalteromonas sp. SSDWG2 TaxID=3139391 RepID=UPI003BA87D14
MKKFGPGLLVTAAFIGPGTITTASVAGANFGFALVWALLFSVFATILLQTMAARLSVISGLDLAHALRRHIHHPTMKAVAILLVISAIGIGSAAYEAGNLSGASLGLQSLFTSVASWVWVPVIAALSALLLFSGMYKLIEIVLISLVVLMGFVFVSTLFIAAPNLTDILGGLTPSLPKGSIITVLALIGTTIVPYNLFLHSGVIAKESQQDNNQQGAIKTHTTDTILSVGVGGLITLAIMATASVAFFGQNQGALSAANMAKQLQPLLGDNAQYFFALGLFAAGLTSAITAPMAGAYAVCGMLGWEMSIKDTRFKLIACAILVFGTLVASLNLNPIEVIIFAQATNALLLPIVCVYLLWLVNNKSVMGRFKNTLALNVVSVPVVLTICALSAYKLLSLF